MEFLLCWYHCWLIGSGEILSAEKQGQLRKWHERHDCEENPKTIKITKLNKSTQTQFQQNNLFTNFVTFKLPHWDLIFNHPGLIRSLWNHQEHGDSTRWRTIQPIHYILFKILWIHCSMFNVERVNCPSTQWITVSRVKCNNMSMWEWLNMTNRINRRCFANVWCFEGRGIDVGDGDGVEVRPSRRQRLSKWNPQLFGQWK
jgi:hypothetical protein